MNVRPHPEVSVVVPTRDRPERLRALLESLRGQTLAPERFEVIVVDDGSAGDTQALLERERTAGGLRLTAMRSARANGPAAARNAGWRRAAAPLVAFIDDDCEAGRGWLEALLGAARRAPGAVIQGPTAALARERDRLGPFSRTREIPSPGPWYESCNILYPRSLLERLGGFDERFPDALGEDTDLGWRALEAGAEAEFAPAARVEHAVEELGPLGTLRFAMRGADAVYAFRRHPALRREALWLGVVRNPALPRLALAVVGIALGRRARPAALLALPYAHSVARRARADGARPWQGPFYLALDLAAAFTSLRGSIRHRTLVL